MKKFEYEIKLNDDGKPYIHLENNKMDAEDRFACVEITRYMIFQLIESDNEFPEDFIKDNLPKAQLVDGVEEVRKAVRKLIGQNVDHIKFFATGGGAWDKERATDMHFSRAEMEVIMEEAQRVGLPVMCHAESVESVKIAVELGVRSIEHADDDNGYELDDETCQRMVEKNPIFNTGFPRSRERRRSFKSTTKPRTHR